VKCNRVLFNRHAITRMFERFISGPQVRKVLQTGEIIEDYPDDTPFPSRLVLGFVENRPLHVVVAENDSTCHIITVYAPELTIWEPDFKTRRHL
jgi:Domain of unknown function (DUF4258)